jgi:hypothetical protein
MIWIADDPHTLGGDAAVEDRGCGSQVVGHGLQAVGLVTVREWSQGRGGEFQVWRSWAVCSEQRTRRNHRRAICMAGMLLSGINIFSRNVF